MTKVNLSVELSETQMEALEFEAKAERKKVQEMVSWIVQQNIPPLLDVIETKDEDRKLELLERLADEDGYCIPAK